MKVAFIFFNLTQAPYQAFQDNFISKQKYIVMVAPSQNSIKLSESLCRERSKKQYFGRNEPRTPYLTFGCDTWQFFKQLPAILINLDAGLNNLIR